MCIVPVICCSGVSSIKRIKTIGIPIKINIKSSSFGMLAQAVM